MLEIQCTCGATLKEDSKFCSQCGSKVIKQKKCQGCANPLEPNDIFCSQCGTKYVEQIHHVSTFNTDNSDPVTWYKQYFEYIGEFKDGYAPVINNIKNPSHAGFVSSVIPEKLKLKKDYLAKTDFPQTYILAHFVINKNFPSNVVWVGEFKGGKALIANADGEVHIIDVIGNVEESRIGTIRDIGQFTPTKGAIVSSTGLNTKMLREYDCIINFKGQLIRDEFEYVQKLGYCDYHGLATFVDLKNEQSNNKVGLLSIISGKKLLEAKFSNFDDEYIVLPDGKKRFFIICSSINSSYAESFGVLDPKKGWVFKPQYSSIQVIGDNDFGDYERDKKLLVCLSSKEEEYETMYRMAVANFDGTILFEYSSIDNNYCIMDGTICVYVKNGNGVSVVSIDNRVIISCPMAENVSYLGDGFFRVHQDGKVGVVNKHGQYTIPLGQFDHMRSYKIHDGGIKVQHNGLEGFVDVQGNVLVPIMYKDIRDEYSLDEYPRILVYPVEGPTWFYINYKNETDGGKTAGEYIMDWKIKNTN